MEKNISELIDFSASVGWNYNQNEVSTIISTGGNFE